LVALGLEGGLEVTATAWFCRLTATVNSTVDASTRAPRRRRTEE